MNKKSFNQKLLDLFSQINSTIKQMLSTLSYIYQSNSIKYEVDDKFQFIRRILTPFEILSYFHVQRLDELIDSKTDSFWSFKDQLKLQNVEEKKAVNMESKHRKIHKNEDSIAQKVKMIGGFRYNNMKYYLKKQFQKRLQQQTNIKKQNDQKILQHSFDNQSGISISSKILFYRAQLTEQQQRKICQWVKRYAEEGKRVSKTDVIHQARIFSKGSIRNTGWCKGFFNRHPQLLQYIKRARPTQRSLISFMYENDQKQRNQSDQSSNQFEGQNQNSQPKNNSQSFIYKLNSEDEPENKYYNGRTAQYFHNKGGQYSNKRYFSENNSFASQNLQNSEFQDRLMFTQLYCQSQFKNSQSFAEEHQ